MQQALPVITHHGRPGELQTARPQNLDNVEVFVWSNVNLAENEHFAPLLPYVRHCRYDARELAAQTPLDGWPGLDARDTECFLDGDLCRLLLMYQLGGVWCDMDATYG